MKITRTINGINTEIELTPAEIALASREFRIACETEDIEIQYDISGLNKDEIIEQFEDALASNDLYNEAYQETIRDVMRVRGITPRKEI